MEGAASGEGLLDVLHLGRRHQVGERVKGEEFFILSGIHSQDDE
jgi:hypothetical protein